MKLTDPKIPPGLIPTGKIKKIRLSPAQSDNFNHMNATTSGNWTPKKKRKNRQPRKETP